MVHFVLHFFPLYHRMPPYLVQQIPEKVFKAHWGCDL